MKSPVFIALALGALTISVFAQPVNTPRSSSTSTSAVSGTSILMPIVVNTTDGKKKLEARLVNLQAAGMELGMERMILEGEADSGDGLNGGKDYAISWGNASLPTKDGGKVSTYIDKPLQSNVSANPTVKSGDSFTAEGEPSELLAAWKRLQEKLKIEDKAERKEAEKATRAPAPTTSFTSNAESPEQKSQTQAPQFQVKANPVTLSTRDGCTMKVDFDQMVAIVQERTLQDGKEVAACQDTLTRYPLEKKHMSCPNFVDLDAKKVYRQYTLSYNDPISGGAIQVADCTRDEQQVTQIVMDTANCSLRHDFTAGKSIQQGRLVYTDGTGAIQELQSCADTETTYEHVKTNDTCTEIVDEANKLVTRQYRYKILRNGADEFVSPCEPDMASATALNEEVCANPRYTSDFAANTSYLNKTYFYTNAQGNRVDVSKCQPSTVSFQHRKDESVCMAINDDSVRQTTMYAKTYVEEETGVPAYLTDCQAVSPAIPYIKTADVWKSQHTAKAQIEPNERDLADLSTVEGLYNGVVTTAGDSGCYKRDYSPYLDEYHAMYPQFTYLGKAINFNKKTTRWRHQGSASNCWTEIYEQKLAGPAMCLIGVDPTSWKTTDGAVIDIANSTALPKTVATVALINMEMSSNSSVVSFRQNSVLEDNRVWMTEHERSTTFSCPKASCDLTTLYSHPVYLRGNQTSYTDYDTVTGTKYVCGNGANLEGKAM